MDTSTTEQCLSPPSSVYCYLARIAEETLQVRAQLFDGLQLKGYPEGEARTEASACAEMYRSKRIAHLIGTGAWLGEHPASFAED